MVCAIFQENERSLLCSRPQRRLCTSDKNRAYCVLTSQGSFLNNMKDDIIALTVVSHDVLEGLEVKHLGLIPAEDFGSGTKIVGKVFAVSPPHHIVPTQVVDVNMKWNVVGRPVS